MAGFGAVGYATRRDLSRFARYLFWALVALIAFGIVLVFVQIRGGELIYAVAGLVIFAGLTAFDFQRLRPAQARAFTAEAVWSFSDKADESCRARHEASAPRLITVRDRSKLGRNASELDHLRIEADDRLATLLREPVAVDERRRA